VTKAARKKAATISFSDAMRDPNLLSAGFGDLSSWETWVVAIQAAFGELDCQVLSSAAAS
jgi:hypothetical protein